MEKVTLEQAKGMADKVNALIQASYVNQSTFTLGDVINAGLTEKQAKRVMGEFVRMKIVFFHDNKYMAHPKTYDKYLQESK